jgi:hypothetical protein
MDAGPDRRQRFARVSTWLFAACLLVAAGLAAFYVRVNDPIRRIYGSYGVWVLQAPDQVEAFRLKDVENGIQLIEKVSNYQVSSGPIALSAEQAKQISRLLLRPSSYPNYVKTCGFDPGVRLDFHRGDEIVQVLFCFACDDLAVYRDDDLIHGAAFDPARGEVVRVIKPLFPDDEVIQSLSEEPACGPVRPPE